MTELQKEYELDVSDVADIINHKNGRAYIYKNYSNWLESLVTTLRIDLQATRITSKMQNAVIESADEEIEHLHSLTRWHYAPEVPEESGQYRCDDDGVECVAVYYKPSNKWFYLDLDLFGEVEVHEIEPIRWAFMPEGE